MQKRILVFDDNQTILDVVGEVLAYEGFVVDEVTSLAQFNSQLAAVHPDLILLNHKLGQYDGTDICRSLKADSATGHIPLIMISAYIGSDQTFKDCNCDASLPKPFDMVQLLDTVQAVFAKYQQE